MIHPSRPYVVIWCDVMWYVEVEVKVEVGQWLELLDARQAPFAGPPSSTASIDDFSESTRGWTL